MAMSKSLITYYSRKGNNYVSGSIVNLPIGNTEVIAKYIHELTESDVFEIETVKKYPDDYTEATEASKAEIEEDTRPELVEKVLDISEYDVIFLGYPIWWSTMPMGVWTFLDTYDFSGKTIVPFCTHEGSGLGRSISDIKKLCPDSTVLDGHAFKGSAVSAAREEVRDWLSNIGLITN